MTDQPRTGGAKDLIGDIAPKLAALTDDVLLADVWNRPGLSPRDRPRQLGRHAAFAAHRNRRRGPSLITVASIITGGSTAQLGGHLQRALANGVTQEELVEAITHLAFSAERPKAMSAAGVLRSVVGDVGSPS